ncbi:MAG TPA: N-acetylneuraminate synthase family protein [Candidatus Tectomicrobia bacterium]
MSLTIDGIRLDDPQHVYVVAEASANHCRDLGKARALVEAAHAAGAQACKFQTFSADRIAAPNIVIPRGFDPAHDAWLDRIGAVTVQDVLAHGGLPWEWHAELKELAASLGITFLSTPFSLDDAKFLVEEIKVPALKIASGDITFTPLLRYAGSTGLPIILSTGASTYREVVDAVLALCMGGGYVHNVALLHCASIYPCPVGAINLWRLCGLQFDRMCGAYGLSDHTLSVDTVPAMAVALGATVYEKHLRLNEGTSVDTDHSLTPDQFKTMVDTLQEASRAMGKEWPAAMHPTEAHERLWMRRSSEDWLRPTQAAREGKWE